MGERPRYTGVFERLDAEYHMVTFDGPLSDFYRRDIEEEQWSALDGPVAGERAVFGSPVEAAALVQAFAISAGADLVGTTVLHDHIVFEGVDIPHGWAVSLAMEMDYSRIITAPEPPSAQEVLRVYWRLGWVVCRTATFIRSLGYPATAHHPRASTGRPPTVLHTMAAIEAVMGGRELPRVSLPPTPRSRQVRELLLQSLYERAIEAMQAERWTRAVNLFNQVLKIEPAYRDAAQKLAYAGLHARLSALYLAARRAMEAERWQEAVDELSEIVSVEPEYQDAADLLSSAALSLAAHRAAEEATKLYEQAMACCDAGEWDAAVACLEEAQRLDPARQDVKKRLTLARRGARRARSPLNSLTVRVRSWLSKTG